MDGIQEIIANLTQEQIKQCYPLFERMVNIRQQIETIRLDIACSRNNKARNLKEERIAMLCDEYENLVKLIPANFS